MDLLTNAKYLKEQAKKIIEDANILDILSNVGDVQSLGSYKHDLMYDPDIDFVVTTNNPRNSSLEALRLFLEDKKFQKFEYGDFVSHPREKRPAGYIICLRKTVENIRWEIEIWFLLEQTKDILKNLNITEKQRLEILKAKHLRANTGLTKHQLNSVEIYKKILNIN